MITDVRKLTLKIVLAVVISCNTFAAADETALRVGSFNVDASPPVGTPMAYDTCVAVGMPLSARGIVLVGDSEPIVLCAVDWIGISNGGYEAWREAIAEAVDTSVERVSVHSLHQHDAPRCDFSVMELLADHGFEGTMFDVAFAREVIANVAEASRTALEQAQVATHVGLGEAEVKKVASTRRILGEDGKIKAVRFTATRDPDVRAEPEGTIDPNVKTISFWNEDDPIVVMTYYATHPQSYYRTGVAHPDFPGMARFIRQATHNGLPHIHFNGAGGDVGAGKYNDGARENRQVLAVRLAEGMAASFQSTGKFPVRAQDLDWSVLPVALPVATHLSEKELLQQLTDEETTAGQRNGIAKDLVWLRRCEAGDTIDVTCLRLGRARILHMPGELSVEYQLAAQRMRPDAFVAMSAYGEYAPGYICMEAHYAQGGYEASPGASNVAPQVEEVLMDAMQQLLQD